MMGNAVVRRDCEIALEERVGYRFENVALLREALTHKSYSNEQVGDVAPFNERLEFLGDAVLDLVISTTLFRNYPELPEGELTRMRADVVSEAGLAEIGCMLNLGECLLFGRGEERSGGRQKHSLIADALEAVLGAVYCDGGFDGACRVANSLFADVLQKAALRKVGRDYKTRLQELLQGRYGRAPQYVLSETLGPDHERTYVSRVQFDGETIGQGQGRTKKASEQEAARQALDNLEA